MHINFKKIDTVLTQKKKNTIEFVEIKLSWTKRRNFGSEFDLDLSCFLLNQSGKISNEKDFVFYNNNSSTCGSVTYYQDNRVGVDDLSSGESIAIDFPKIRSEILQVIVVVSIHDAKQRGQNFGFINDARLDVVNRATHEVLAHYDLSEELACETAVVTCGFFLKNNEWTLKNIDEPRAETLAELAKHYGIHETHT